MIDWFGDDEKVINQHINLIKCLDIPKNDSIIYYMNKKNRWERRVGHRKHFRDSYIGGSTICIYDWMAFWGQPEPQEVGADGFHTCYKDGTYGSMW